MGSSSKKSKKESKHKKHKRSSPSYERDDSYSPDEKRRRHDSEDEERRSREKKRHKKKSKRERDHERESPHKEEKGESRREGRRELNGKSSKKEDVTPEDESNANGEGSASLSIEETNKLRAKLGLKPLEVNDGSKDENSEKKADFVHAPAEDLWEKKKQEDIREKLKAIKERRNMNKKIGKVKKITDQGDDEDMASWVQQSRIREQKKKQVEEREKELAKMDAEFGLGGLVKKELNEMRNESYTSRDLKGMTVKHSVELFKEGRSEILTLEDKNILDDDNEDVLVGTNLVDAEKAKRNIEIRSKGSGYQAYEEEEVDELGFFKPKALLSKYDEEIEGVKKDEFKIGAHGKVDTTWEQQKEQMKREIKAQGVSLAPPQLKIASEYLTEDEMKFKKRKKKVRKVRKRENFKADDLLPLPGSQSSSDFGTRGKIRPGSIPGWDEGIESAKVEDTSITSTTMMVESSKGMVIDDDDAGNELQKALDKARKAKFVKARMTSEDNAAAKVMQHMEALNRVKIENPIANYSTTISLNSTDEFCRQVGIASELGAAKESLQDDTVESMEVNAEYPDDEEESSGWNFVKEDSEHPETSSVNHKEEEAEDDDDHAPIEAEPLAGGGLAGALKLAERKGYLLEEKKKSAVIVTNKQKELLSANYSIEDKNAVDHLDKYAHEKYSKDRSRHDRGIVTEFEEKKNYKPKIKIEYVDEGGRLMDPKEAFRKLSHRFHGKGSGKMKQEKRQKKKQEEDMMMKMSSTDTPLNTVAMMKDKLQTEASPYIVLSGAGKTFQTGGAGLMSKK